MRKARYSAGDWERLFSTGRGSEVVQALDPFYANAPRLRPPVRNLQRRLDEALTAIQCRCDVADVLRAGKTQRAYRALKEALPRQFADRLLCRFDDAGWAGVGCGLAQAVRLSKAGGLALLLLREKGGNPWEAVWAELSCLPGWGWFDYPAGETWAHPLQTRARTNFITLVQHLVIFSANGGPEAEEGLAAIRPFLELYLEGNLPIGWIDGMAGSSDFLVVAE